VIKVMWRTTNFAGMILIAVSVCSACSNTPRNSTEQNSESNNLAEGVNKIKKGEEEEKLISKTESDKPLDEIYRNAQSKAEDGFVQCFQSVFKNKTFDDGIPWKSEGQGGRRIISVTNAKQVEFWNINKVTRTCEKYHSEPFRGVNEEKLVVRVRRIPYMYKYEEGGNLLCKYREDEDWEGGVTRHCNSYMPDFIPG